MSKRALDFFNRSGSANERIRQSLRVVIISNVILLVASTGATIHLWYAIATYKTWHELQGVTIGATEFKHDTLLFAPLAVSAVSLALLIRYYKARISNRGITGSQ